jgi:hypothetical protein
VGSNKNNQIMNTARVESPGFFMSPPQPRADVSLICPGRYNGRRLNSAVVAFSRIQRGAAWVMRKWLSLWAAIPIGRL